MPPPIPPGAPRHTQAAYLLSRIGREQSATFAARMESLGLRPKHFAVLNAIALADGGASQQELGRRLGLDPSGLVGVVDELERMGLVTRRRDQSDRRRYAIGLTPAGTAMLRRARRQVSDSARRLLRPLSEGEIEALVALLARVAEGSERDATGARGRPRPRPR